MWKGYLSIGTALIGSLVLSVGVAACSKSEAEVAIEATKAVEATFSAHLTATVVADEEKAGEIIGRFCDVADRRFETNEALSSYEEAQFLSTLEWIDYNIEPDSEFALIVEALTKDSEKVMDGTYSSWHDAYIRSGSKYMSKCRIAAWK